MKQLFIPHRPSPVETETPAFLTSWRATLQKYQTVIFFIMLVISLIIFLLLWRGYRFKQMKEKGWLELERASRIEEFQSLLQVYGSTDLVPLIHYKLANAYFEAENYPAAKKEYELIIKEYPQEPVSQWVPNRLKELQVNEGWAPKELPKRLDELRNKRDMPLVLIKTKKGDVEIELYEDDAPNTVANFISLIDKGFYNGARFGPQDEKIGLSLNEQSITATITTTLHYTIPFEVNNLKNKEGSLGMLRTIDPDTVTGRPERDKFLNSADWKFYIVLKANPEIDTKYTVFGWVSKGMNLIKEMQAGDIIDAIVINKKRSHEYQPAIIEKKE